MNVNGCCGYSLRTTGLIFAWFWLIVSICFGFDGVDLFGYSLIPTILIEVVVTVFCLIGIYYDKHNYLLPFIIALCIDTAVAIRMIADIPTDWFGPRFMTHMVKYVITHSYLKLNQSLVDDMDETMGIFYISIWIVCAIFAAIGIYTVLVMYSLYKGMKTAARQSLPK